MTKIKDIKKGEWFTRKEIVHPNENQVYVRGDYIPEKKRYECSKWSDINSVIYLSGDTEVYTNFIF